MKDLEHKLKIAKEELAEVEGVDYDKIEEMLADFDQKFDACNSSATLGNHSSSRQNWGSFAVV